MKEMYDEVRRCDSKTGELAMNMIQELYLYFVTIMLILTLAALLSHAIVS